MKYWSGYCSDALAPKETDLYYMNIRQKPFKIYGIYDIQPDNYYRLPLEFAETVSGGVAAHTKSSAGVRVRFATDSPYIAIRAELSDYSEEPHLTCVAKKGFDLYTEENGRFIFHNTYNPPLDLENQIVGITHFSKAKKRNIVINFPIAVTVIKVEVGIKNGCSVYKSSEYVNAKPMVFYGSSITQGFAASRPGNSYENFISRELNADYINLGFSGSALGEKAIAEYISNIPMSAFILDYDHNAPDVEHLKDTHYVFYKTVREKNPNLPIVLVSRPASNSDNDTLARKQVIIDTFNQGKNNGDNVCFVDGGMFFPKQLRFDCTVDGCHPNDLGMYYIASGILKVLSEINLQE